MIKCVRSANASYALPPALLTTAKAQSTDVGWVSAKTAERSFMPPTRFSQAETKYFAKNAIFPSKKYKDACRA